MTQAAADLQVCSREPVKRTVVTTEHCSGAIGRGEGSWRTCVASAGVLPYLPVRRDYAAAGDVGRAPLIASAPFVQIHPATAAAPPKPAR